MPEKQKRERGYCYSIREAAKILGISVGTANSYERRALKKMRKHPILKQLAIDLNVLPEQS